MSERKVEIRCDEMPNVVTLVVFTEADNKVSFSIRHIEKNSKTDLGQVPLTDPRKKKILNVIERYYL